MQRMAWVFALIALLVSSPAGAVSNRTSGVEQRRAVENRTYILDVNVVSMEAERVLAGQTVVVEGEWIVYIGPTGRTPVPAGAEVIDGRGRYLLPGLVDAHIHLVHEADLPLLLSYGVTTVRNMNGRPFHLGWRDEVARGQRVGPRIVTAGPMLGETPLPLNADGSPRLAEEILAQKQAGYDFLKVGDDFPAGGLAELFALAGALGMDVVGHTPNGSAPADFIAYAPHSLEHLDGLASLDESRWGAVMDTLKRNGVWVTPTLTIWQQFTAAEGGPGAAQLALAGYTRTTGRFSPCLAGGGAGRGYQLTRPSAHRLALVTSLHEKGVPLLLGTDAPFLCTSPGASVHEELQNLVEAGLTPYEALQTATVHPARFLGMAERLGTVQVGKVADLLLVDGNPLQEISATRRIVGVMARGVWYPHYETLGLGSGERFSLP